MCSQFPVLASHASYVILVALMALVTLMTLGEGGEAPDPPRRSQITPIIRMISARIQWKLQIKVPIGLALVYLANGRP